MLGVEPEGLLRVVNRYETSAAAESVAVELAVLDRSQLDERLPLAKLEESESLWQLIERLSIVVAALGQNRTVGLAGGSLSVFSAGEVPRCSQSTSLECSVVRRWKQHVANEPR